MENPETTDETLSPEELQDEQEALAEVEDGDLRSNVIESLGLEENDDNSELINKVVEHEKANREKLSKAIGQKIDWREKAKQSNTQPEKQSGEEKDSQPLDVEAIRKETEATVRQQLDDEFLEESDYSDKLKEEMRKVAKINGTSVRAVVKDSYIQHLVEGEQSEQRAAEAANNGTGERRSGTDAGSEMPDKFNDPAFMSSEEGQKEYSEWEKSRQNK